MSTQILIKRSSTAGSAPTTSDIATGELAVNTVDKRIFTNNAGTIVELGTYPSTQAVQGNATVGGTLGVTGATTLSSGSAATWTVTGTLTVPTPSNSTDAASKGYVDAQVSSVIDSAPSALNTLNELAAALNDDANFATTVTNALATKLALAGGTMTGNIVMGANSITSTATPATADTLTRKGYVDGLYQSTVDAEVSAAAAAASATAAAGSASSASTSATTATTQASAASTSATSAASSATAAATSATSSANSATASATSATQSAASATQAQALVDSIESFYLGAEASAPTVDDNGDPLQAGDWYFNTTDSSTYIYNGSSWQSVSPDLVSDLTPQLGGNLDTNGNDINFGDNDKAIFGAGSDLQIYHSGTNSFIKEVGTGNLYIDATNLNFRSGDLTDTYLNAVQDGAVNLYYDNAPKLSTTSTGIDVTGTATMDGLTSTGDVLINGGTNTLDLFNGSGQYALNRTSTTVRLSSGGNVAIASGYPTRNTSAYFASNGDISFYEDTGSTPKLTWDASAESLGIGTSSPSSALDVIGEATIGNGTDGIKLSYSTSSNAGVIDTADTSDTLSVRTSGTERMRIDSSGNVGIGVSSPSLSFEVGQNTAKGYMHSGVGVFSVGTSTNHPYGFDVNGSERMRIDSSGNLLVGTNSVTDAGHTVLKASGKNSLIYGGNEFNFADNYTVGGGDLYLNYAPLAGGGTIGKYHFLQGDAGHNYSILRASAFTTTSDYRTKENIVPLENAVDRVKQLKPCRFNFIDGVGMEAGRTVDGFIAHEAQEVVPEAVEGVKDAMTTKTEIVTPAQYDEEGNLVSEAVREDVEIPAYQGIDQSKLVPLLTAALQEALTRIETLEAKVAVLENN